MASVDEQSSGYCQHLGRAIQLESKGMVLCVVLLLIASLSSVHALQWNVALFGNSAIGFIQSEAAFISAPTLGDVCSHIRGGNL